MKEDLIFPIITITNREALRESARGVNNIGYRARQVDHRLCGTQRAWFECGQRRVEKQPRILQRLQSRNCSPSRLEHAQCRDCTANFSVWPLESAPDNASERVQCCAPPTPQLREGQENSSIRSALGSLVFALPLISQSRPAARTRRTLIRPTSKQVQPQPEQLLQPASIKSSPALFQQKTTTRLAEENREDIYPNCARVCLYVSPWID